MEKLKGVGTRARALAETAKRSSELSDTKAAMGRAFRALGEAHYAGDSARAAELVGELNRLSEHAEALTREIDALRDERRCTRCGAVQSRDNRYCAQCGAALETHEAKIHWPAAEPQEEAPMTEEKTEG